MLLMPILYVYYFNVMQVNLGIVHLFLFPPTNTYYFKNRLTKKNRVVQVGLIPLVFCESIVFSCYFDLKNCVDWAMGR